MKPTVIIVGADKGGVGKTTVTRLLLDYLASNGIEYRAYDTQRPDGALKNFFGETTTVVDLEKSDDQVKVFDNLSPSYVSVIDIQAGLLSKTLTLLSEIGFLDMAREGKLQVVVLHVLGPAAQSLSEVAPIIAALQGSRHITIANHINDTEYKAPDGAVVISKLDELAAKSVDTASLGFVAYTQSDNSLTLRGKVRHWMGKSFDAFNAVGLNRLA